MEKRMWWEGEWSHLDSKFDEARQQAKHVASLCEFFAGQGQSTVCSVQLGKRRTSKGWKEDPVAWGFRDTSVPRHRTTAWHSSLLEGHKVAFPGAWSLVVVSVGSKSWRALFRKVTGPQLIFGLSPELCKFHQFHRTKVYLVRMLKLVPASRRFWSLERKTRALQTNCWRITCKHALLQVLGSMEAKMARMERMAKMAKMARAARMATGKEQAQAGHSPFPSLFLPLVQFLGNNEAKMAKMARMARMATGKGHVQSPFPPVLGAEARYNIPSLFCGLRTLVAVAATVAQLKKHARSLGRMLFFCCAAWEWNQHQGCFRRPGLVYDMLIPLRSLGFG